MIYRILRRILRKHALFHLLIPLVAGVFVELLYTKIVDGVLWSGLPDELLSGRRIALYMGIFLAYVLVIGILIKRETTVGLQQIELNILMQELSDAKSLFAIGTLRFDEWFDPAVQVYLATVFSHKLTDPSFRYERVLLLGSRSAKKNLRSDYLDGYHAKCLIGIHRQLGIKLYFLEWPQIIAILNQLTVKEAVDLGFYPRYITHLSKLPVRVWMWLRGRSRVRKVAVGVIEAADGAKSAFRFLKRDNIVSVKVEPKAREESCIKFVELIRQEIYDPETGHVKPQYDFNSYY